MTGHQKIKHSLVLFICLIITGCAAGMTRLYSETGCILHYTMFRAAIAATDEWVVIGHGFLRNQTRMHGLAQAIAAAGMNAVTVDFCNMRLWNGAHRRNAQDLIAVATALKAQRVIYAGFSAGALAALIAGASDAHTVGVVTLDLVDAEHLGVSAARDFKQPFIGLVGDPSPCNAQNNGLSVFTANPFARVIHIDGASHCDFEMPTDLRCRWLCEKRTSPNEQRREQIIQTTTALIHSLMFHVPPN
ncbi:alpha/beta hydrolase [Chromatium okenii]|uniref:Alpha/beta hydrolase n=2 Tax=Chromatium okenii TaxID=61644 RepID=A0A2S7XTY2_9GAMM|nr:alpha/beta hydrolase [Chromatium okenii]